MYYLEDKYQPIYKYELKKKHDHEQHEFLQELPVVKNSKQHKSYRNLPSQNANCLKSHHDT